MVTKRDWPEDFAHENGNYQVRCVSCDGHFLGHKRRTLCRVCAEGTENANFERRLYKCGVSAVMLGVFLVLVQLLLRRFWLPRWPTWAITAPISALACGAVLLLIYLLFNSNRPRPKF